MRTHAGPVMDNISTVMMTAEAVFLPQRGQTDRQLTDAADYPTQYSR